MNLSHRFFKRKVEKSAETLLVLKYGYISCNYYHQSSDWKTVTILLDSGKITVVKISTTTRLFAVDKQNHTVFMVPGYILLPVLYGISDISCNIIDVYYADETNDMVTTGVDINIRNPRLFCFRDTTALLRNRC